LVDFLTKRNKTRFVEITIGRIPESDDVTRSRRRTLAVKRLIRPCLSLTFEIDYCCVIIVFSVLWTSKPASRQFHGRLSRLNFRLAAIFVAGYGLAFLRHLNSGLNCGLRVHP